MHDVLVLGSGVAGLSTALAAARAGRSVVVLTKSTVADTATRWAQGGVAAALEAPDSADLHLADTLLAGVGLCDPDAVHALVHDGPARVRELALLGARFDADEHGDWELAREGGHSLARVVHAGGDATGAEIERALVAAVGRADIDVREGWTAIDLLVEEGRCVGVLALDPTGLPTNVRAGDTVLATGGAGQCFAVTTNPELSTGSGIALALRAGVACADLEFVQFHPTALHVDAMPRPLLSEALRGEGAVLRNDEGTEFMVGQHPMRDLAPRDVVARSIAEQLRERSLDHVWLDATMIDDFTRRFPTISRHCLDNGLDPTADWLPVAPAAHYMCGGVVTDLDGATTLPGLWACGETACSGVHGANRLASNSLLEGLVFGQRVIDAVVAGRSGPLETGAMRGVPELVAVKPTVHGAPVVVGPDAAGATVDAAALRASVQRVMSRDCAVVRSGPDLALAGQTLSDLADLGSAVPPRDPGRHAALDVLSVARAITASALARMESRGAHTRVDHPATDDHLVGRFVVVGAGAPQFVELGSTARARSGRRRR